MKHKQVEKFILSLAGSKLDYPFGEDVAVYKAKDKMFALIAEKSDPVRISLKCDPKLSEVLRNKYESVMPGYHLNKNHWNTIILSGQLPWEDIQALIKHSYFLVLKTKSDTPTID
ncbi:MAG: MmcQ/YjbR family DNA-binding protein [Candidatus Saccharimonadales bacterium]